MIAMRTKRAGFAALHKAVGGINKDFRKRVAKALNATARKGKSTAAKSISRELAAKQKVIKAQMTTGRATAATLTTNLTIKKSGRIPLRDFGARQVKSGVSYRISKTQGRKRVLGAFQGPRPGVMKVSWRGNVFKRMGKARLPIVKLYGPSPWGVFVKQEMGPAEVDTMEKELKKQVQRQIREVALRVQGIIKG